MKAKGKEPNQKRIATLVKSLLKELGEDPERNGLKKTPERVARSLTYLTRGYRQDLKAVVKAPIFAVGGVNLENLPSLLKECMGAGIGGALYKQGKPLEKVAEDARALVKACSNG